MGTTQNRIAKNAAGFRKLRPVVRLGDITGKGGWYTFQLIESQSAHRMNQNPWPCFRSQNEITVAMSEIRPRPPLEGTIKSKGPEIWQCFMPSGGSG